MDCAFIIHNEDQKTVLATSDGYRHSPPIATQRAGETLVSCAMRGYKEMFGDEIPNHLISLNDRDIIQTEGMTIYCVNVQDDSARILPPKWIALDKAASSRNPFAVWFQTFRDRGMQERLVSSDERTVIIPDILASLPYSNDTVSLYREYTRASLLEAKLHFRMYRGYLETLRLIFERNADMRKDDHHIWNERGFRVIGTERGVSLECPLTTNPHTLVEQYQRFLRTLHYKMDAHGIATV